MEPEIKGLHHITAITSDAASAARFYTQILGLRLVKKTVNFDDPTAYHLYFGDEVGKPGTIITFFDWGTGISHGRVGAGVTQHLAFTTEDGEALSKWKQRLEQNGVEAFGPLERGSFKSVYLRDPDGLILEIATHGSGKGYTDSAHPESMIFPRKQKPATKAMLSETPPPPSSEMGLQGLHHVTAISQESPRSENFYTDLLNLELVKETGSEQSSGTSQQIFGLSQGAPGTMITFLGCPELAHGTVGIGTVHHIAFAVEDADEQLRWRKRLSAHGVNVTQVMDRKYFKSIYFREPNGLLLEIATIPPGFTVDEPKDRLGLSLALPEWLESHRPLIEASLKPIGGTK